MAGLNAWLATAAAAFNRFGLLGLIAVAFTEQTFFPIPTDLLLIPLCIARPGLSLWYALIGTITAVAGGLFGYFLGERFGRPLLDRFFSRRVVGAIDGQFSRYGGWAIALGAMGPLPYRVLVIAAGVFGMARRTVIVNSFAGHGLRFFGEALAIMILGDRGIAFIGDNFDTVMIVAAVVFVIGWFLVKRTRLAAGITAWLNARLAQLQALYEARLRPLGAYGFVLIGGTALAGLGLGLFTVLTADPDSAHLAAFNANVTAAIRALGANAQLVRVAKLFAPLASGPFLGGLALATAACLWFVARRPWRIGGGTLGLLIGAAIGASRLYLGYNLPSDIFAGFAAGLFWTATCLVGGEMVRRQRATGQPATGIENDKNKLTQGGRHDQP